MRKFLILIIIIFTLNITYSQNRIVVLDSLNHKPIPFANISFGKNNGLYTDENGYFEINKNSIDTLNISHISYNSYTIKSSEIKDAIMLSQNAILLKEVVVSNKKRISKYIDFPKKNNNFSSWPVSPKSEIVTLIIPNLKNTNSILKNFTFNFAKKKEKNSNITSQTAVRINLYTADKNQNIKKHIYSSQVIYINPNKKEKLELDVEQEEILLTKKGLFLGLEVIGDIDSSGNILKEKSFVHITLTDNKIDDYSSKSYIKYVFDRKLNLTDINDIIKNTSGKAVNRSMSFGITIYKPD